MQIGYARVSTEDQNLDLQRDALITAGCERILEDNASGVRNDRPGLAEALSHCGAAIASSSGGSIDSAAG
jgi:DNA invertase Pin-like site-specific DNA recombinase